ncbi:MAG: methylthioribulose 1-phosphate dehydratase, partial [Alcanivorax sp.]
MPERPYSTTVFRDAARALAATGQRIYANGWSPATSSNYSQRLNTDFAAVTQSGKDKGLLRETDIMAVNMDGQPASSGKPSAETLLHTQLYRFDGNIQAVLHTHSHASTVLTMHWPANSITLEGYELLKALQGLTSHNSRLTIPVFENTQDIAALAAKVDQQMRSGHLSHAYLIRGHGLYT